MEATYRLRRYLERANRMIVNVDLMSSVQSVMGAQLMRRSMCSIQRIFFAVAGPVKYWTDNLIEPVSTLRSLSLRPRVE